MDWEEEAGRSKKGSSRQGKYHGPQEKESLLHHLTLCDSGQRTSPLQPRFPHM